MVECEQEINEFKSCYGYHSNSYFNLIKGLWDIRIKYKSSSEGSKKQDELFLKVQGDVCNRLRDIFARNSGLRTCFKRSEDKELSEIYGSCELLGHLD